ncbi:MAG: hypothetical protein BWY57_02325 [Betaproteobacteria bacterium ADurb.Bin341]|nr:MAG: hypothetical protein BWY57_02325 [Betaproteobacteria bacterium ADurb.Bin341]
MVLRNQKHVLLAGGSVLLLCFAWLYTHYRQFFPPCMFHQLTGLHCPGCGATRALYALLHLDLARALHMNALFILVGLPVLAILGLEMMQEKLYVSARAHKWMAYGYLILAVLFTIARNIPLPPFSLLAPY